MLRDAKKKQACAKSQHRLKVFFKKDALSLSCRNKSYFCVMVLSLPREFHSRRKSPKRE